LISESSTLLLFTCGPGAIGLGFEPPAGTPVGPSIQKDRSRTWGARSSGLSLLVHRRNCSRDSHRDPAALFVRSAIRAMNLHLTNLVDRRPELASCHEEIDRVFAALCGSLRQGGKLLLCGNGGSAADAEHWTGELLKGFCSKRPLSTQDKASLPADLGAKLQGGIPAIPLTGFTALTTAFSNDVDPSLTFAQLVWALGKPGDVLIGISTSGNAANVCAAMGAAQAKGLVRIGLTGQTGGKLLPLTDLCIRVPATETYRIQEFHLPVYHCLSLMLEDEFFPSI
jgi:D-sedoheptulose 7-phosphate isomerase